MSRREIFLDRGVGESRGVVTLDGRPERLLIRREGDPVCLGLGARSIARVRKVEPAFASAFLELPDGQEAILALRPDAPRPVQGGAVEIEIRGEPRRGKLATAWMIGPAEGAPALLAPAPGLQEELQALGKVEEIETGSEARAAADEAEAEAMALVHPLPGGGSLAIEPTRALTAIDVDTGDRTGGDSKRVARQTNLAAINEAARLLRLKGIGGLVVVDLAGRGHDGHALLAAVRTAFGPDNPGVAIGPLSRFGTIELTVPRRRRPVLERLLTETGVLTPLTAALRLARAMEREGRAAPGAGLLARCNPAVEAAFSGLAPAMTDLLGGRFVVEARSDWSVDRMDVSIR